jgi:hypothetical protein
MANRHDLHEALLTRSEQRLHVARKHSCEGLLLFPFWMLRGERLYPVNGEGELEIDRLLGPERAVVVESSNALLRPNEVRRSFLCYLLNEGNDGFLRRSVVPRRQRVVSANRPARNAHHDEPQRAPYEFGFHIAGCSSDVSRYPDLIEIVNFVLSSELFWLF